MEGRYLVLFQFGVVPPYWVVHPKVAFQETHLYTFVSFSREVPYEFLRRRRELLVLSLLQILNFSLVLTLY